MPGYQVPCKYCGQLVPPDASVCPACSKVDPAGPLRCPACRAPIQPGWVSCSNCGLSLTTTCPVCGKETFFGDYCEECGGRLTVTCPHKKCGAEQPPIGDTCAVCGKSLKRGGK